MINIKICSSLITAILLALSLTVFGQSIVEMTPTLGSPVNKSPEGEIEFYQGPGALRNRFGKKLKIKMTMNKLTAKEKKILENCEDKENYYDILGYGCSWYCGGGQDTATASSELKPFKGIKYSASNADDLSYKTAWIEGVPGYGIGEYLVYHFSTSKSKNYPNNYR